MRKFIVQLSISLLFLGFFAIQIDWREMRFAFSQVTVPLYVLSTFTALLGPIVMAGKYHLLISRTSLALSFRRLVAINYIARFYALFLPTALGPEAIRWYKITKNKEGKSFFLASTIVERIFFIMVLFICGSVPLILTQVPETQRLAAGLWPILTGISIGFFLMLIYFFWPKLHKAVRGFIIEKFDLAPESRLHTFLLNFSLQNASLKVLLKLFLLTIVWQVVFLIRMYFLFASMGLPFGFWDVAWMGSLVLLLQVIPISFAGLGVREGAFAFLFSLHGIATESAIVLGLLFFSQMLFLCFVGYCCQLFEKKTEVRQNSR